MTDEERLVAMVAERAAGVPEVEAVALGGSRAQGGHHDGSDFDFGLYYRGGLDPADVRALGWPGEVSAIGGWGGGVMNGGAWLTVDGHRVDLHYRDLGEVEHWWAEAEQGRFDIERLLFYLAGIPTYIVVGELAIAQVLAGSLPRPEFPAALREEAPRRWQTETELTLAYAEAAYARRGDAVGCAGLLAQAVLQAAHARVAAAGEWALNEKRLVQQAGLTHLASHFARLGQQPEELRAAVAELRAELKAADG